MYFSISQQIRQHVLEMIFLAKASHIGSCFSIADILSVLYFSFLRIDPREPLHPDRDRCIVSKGHAAAAVYATLAVRGFFPVEELKTFCQPGSLLLGHLHHKVCGVELSTGSLGHGLSVGCGLALAAHRERKSYRTVVIVSDGEMNEGSIWEAALFAAHHKLSQLVCIVDYNKIQSFGSVEEVLTLASLSEKFLAFGWEVEEIDGHDHQEIERALHRKADKPLSIIAHTVKGKGVSFMENQLAWHYKNPSYEEYQKALQEVCDPLLLQR